jgi:hypothetical protein
MHFVSLLAGGGGSSFFAVCAAAARCLSILSKAHGLSLGIATPSQGTANHRVDNTRCLNDFVRLEERDLGLINIFKIITVYTKTHHFIEDEDEKVIVVARLADITRLSIFIIKVDIFHIV